jgi:hypothetical protein
VNYTFEADTPYYLLHTYQGNFKTFLSRPIKDSPVCVMEYGGAEMQWLSLLNWALYRVGARRGAVVKTLRYKSEGRGIDSRWCHWNFSLT